jgi:hypothetical protein
MWGRGPAQSKQIYKRIFLYELLCVRFMIGRLFAQQCMTLWEVMFEILYTHNCYNLKKLALLYFFFLTFKEC